MSWGNSHLSAGSSHGNEGLSRKLSTSEHFTPANFSPWVLQKEQKPQRRNFCLRRAEVGGPERGHSDSSLGRRPLLTIW